MRDISNAQAARRTETVEPEWRTLSHRVIWVDLAVAIISLAPGLLGIWLDPSSAGALWLLGLLSLIGVVGAIVDALRWVSTRYRVTSTEVQRRSGIFIRRYRTVKRDRIRSVDTYAHLRHRLTWMRVVSIGAGQQTSTGEMAFKLDALTKHGAEELRREILGITDGPAPASREVVPAPVEESPEQSERGMHVEVLEKLQFRWVWYNIFTIWAYVIAAGIVWMVAWLLSSFGVDLVEAPSQLVSDLNLTWVMGVVIILVAGGVVGVIALGVLFILENWKLELARVHSTKGTFLRTRRGLFSKREVNRDEARIRGISIDEPLVWRWMGMADTNVLTTGLSLKASEEATAPVPRGPISVARRVAEAVVGDAFRTTTTLPRHPRAALRRRLVWATSLTLGVIGAVVVPIFFGPLPLWTLWIAIGLGPVAIVGAFIAYASLGHMIHGDFVITRSGLFHRSTAVLRRDAVSTVAVRQSILQRRLGLSTVFFMTAAGWGEYDAPDVDANAAFTFARDAAPGILDPFLDPRHV